MAVLRAYEASSAGGSEGASAVQGYMAAAGLAHGMLENVMKPEDQLRQDLEALALRASSRKVPEICELTGGEHTSSLEPPPASDKDHAPGKR
jgi:hypothetical protein